MRNNISVAVTSRSFSNHPHLRDLVKASFNHVAFCDKELKSHDELISFLKDHDAAIIGLEKISRYVIDALPKLKAISKYGVGLDNIDIEALKDKGIYLGWSPGVNARSVAELTLCFMLGLIMIH